MKLRELVATIHARAPQSLQESYDNAGIQFGDPEKEITSGLVCLDITEDVLDEAIRKKCNVVMSHHPLLFSGMKSITGRHYTQRVLVKAIQNDIALVSSHTNLDFVIGGVNEKIASKLGLEKPEILDKKKGLLKKLVVFCPSGHADKVREAIFNAGAGHIGEYDCCSFNLEGKGSFRAGEGSDPFVGKKGEIHFEEEVRVETILPDFILSGVVKAMIKAHPYEEVAYDIYPLDNEYEKAGGGIIAQTREQVDEPVFLDHLKSVLKIPVIRHSPFTGKKINKVAICGGSGSFLKGKAYSMGADIFITADIKYHEFFEYQREMLIADAGHFETEQFTSELIVEIVKENFANFALQISESDVNPVKYY